MSKLYLIEKPSEIPTSIDDYRKQNYLLQIIPQLSLGFDGVKLGNWGSDNTEHPYILAGSIVEFLGDLYEAKEDIYLNDPREGISVYQNLQHKACMTVQNFLQYLFNKI